MPNQIMYFVFSFYKPSTKNVFFHLISARFCYHETAPRGSLLFLINEGILWNTTCTLIVNHFCWTPSENLEKWHWADWETSEVSISQAVIAGTCQVFKLNLDIYLHVCLAHTYFLEATKLELVISKNILLCSQIRYSVFSLVISTLVLGFKLWNSLIVI